MKDVLTPENILLNVVIQTKEEAIKLAGRILVENGYVTEDYIKKMLKREEMVTTYMGNSIAIPHGTDESKSEVLNSGISVIQISNGVDFGNGNIAKVVFGIAGNNNEHVELLSQIAILCSEEENVEKIVQITSKEQLMTMFSEVE